MKKYFHRYPNDEKKAIKHYELNIEISESFYPVLSMFEVALRNSLNRELTKYFESEDWYLKVESVPGLRNLKNNLNPAKRHITRRNENITAHKVVAELTLGFWVRLFNAGV